MSFFKSKESKTNGEEFVEVELEKKEKSKINIKIEELSDISDVDKIQADLRDGFCILLIKIKKLRDKDINELKRSVEKLKKTCTAVNGSITGIEDNWLILTPGFANVIKS